MAIDWQPYERHMQNGMKDGTFANGQFVYIAAGPPHLENLGAGGGGQPVVGTSSKNLFPVGMCQNLSLSHNRAFSRIFELGSERSYFIPGRTVGQLMLSRVYFHGPNILRALYAYYTDEAGVSDITPLATDHDLSSLYPYTEAGSSLKPGESQTLHQVQIPPGFENMWMNLASDIFQVPFGLMILIKDSNEKTLGGCYVEQCYLPTHTWAVDSSGLIMQESVGIQFERLVPLKTSVVKLIGSGLEELNPINYGATLDTALPG